MPLIQCLGTETFSISKSKVNFVDDLVSYLCVKKTTDRIDFNSDGLTKVKIEIKYLFSIKCQILFLERSHSTKTGKQHFTIKSNIWQILEDMRK